jgi:hypothetical protein
VVTGSRLWWQEGGQHREQEAVPITYKECSGHWIGTVAVGGWAAQGAGGRPDGSGDRGQWQPTAGGPTTWHDGAMCPAQRLFGAGLGGGASGRRPD